MGLPRTNTGIGIGIVMNSEDRPVAASTQQSLSTPDSDEEVCMRCGQEVTPMQLQIRTSKGLRHFVCPPKTTN